MEIKSVEVNVCVQYEPTYVGSIPHWTTSNRNFFVDEEKYRKLLELLEEE